MASTAHRIGQLDCCLALGIKTADVGYSVNIPRTPFGISTRDREERLPGMNRWVPRHTLERAFDGLEVGFDPDAVLDQESERGHLAYPAVGAAAGAGLAHMLMPKSGLGGALVGGFLGGAGGSLLHGATEQSRLRPMREALKGAVGERARQPSEGQTPSALPPGFALKGQQQQTASEAIPLIARTGGSGA